MNLRVSISYLTHSRFLKKICLFVHVLVVACGIFDLHFGMQGLFFFFSVVACGSSSVCVCVCVSCSVVSDSLQPHRLQPARLPCPWNSPGKNTGVGCHFLLQGIFLTQGLNLGLPHCGQILYHLSQPSSLIRDQIQAPCIGPPGKSCSRFKSNFFTYCLCAF